jgi:hypothetical protein
MRRASASSRRPAAPSTIARNWTWIVSEISSHEPMYDLSAGIWTVFSQVPLTRR